MVKNPTISIILPVYNGAAYLSETMNSLLVQQFQDFELLVIDDASTDESHDVISSFSDPRIRYIRNETNLRLSNTLNKGITLSTGRYIARMDQDDIALPERLEEQFRFMEDNADIALCGTWFQNFGDRTDIERLETSHEAIVFRLLHQFHMLHPSWMMRRSIIDRYALRYSPEVIANDYDLVVRMVDVARIANIPKVLMRYRQDGGTQSKVKHGTIIVDSNRIRKHLFRSVGLEVTDEDLELYTAIAQREYHSDKTFVTNAGSLLQRMIESNRRTHFFSDHFFQQRLGFMWFHTCTNAKLPGTWLRQTYSGIPVLQNRKLVSMGEWVRFIGKSLVR